MRILRKKVVSIDLWKKKVFKCEREVNIKILGGSHRENVKIKENIASVPKIVYHRIEIGNK